ncbi:MAG: glycerophosphodiester phosphodiesterase family protein [Pelagibacteraceae bacterium]
MHLIHRGLVNKKLKENLLASFKQSFKKGFGIETDIHATKDKQFVCFHDFTLKRTFNISKSIKNLNYQRIKEISKSKKAEIPLLSDLLKLSKKRFFLFIEIKPLFTKDLLKKLIAETKAYSKCVFISFKHKNIYDILKIKKQAKVGLSFGNNISAKTIINQSKNKNINCIVLDRCFLENKKIKNLKKEKYFYTIKTKKDFLKYQDNNLIFENL